ncbi:MAG: tRNA (adenosine(37)-N6)-threonylcarbamoyltransferase complex ATPase subunit type 1 TsaE [Candidatus Omnitrophica bacterium]|nr:tRNA (adenosine(37)-N6)-threonylcarbamoyltransferase complex ATPase subunit type 1 TsaE [Candidatus Omnitrophota bacterium]
MVIFTKTPEETIKLGEKIAGSLKKGDVIGFIGELGSGKTTMIKGIVRRLTGKDAVSPSFVLINEYSGKTPVFHFDLYRLKCKIELETIGWDEYPGKGIVLVEWADKIKGILPPETIFIRFSILNGERKIVISGLKKRKNDKSKPPIPPFCKGGIKRGFIRRKIK